MQPKAIIFDVDGTLADTEELGHLPSCNESFQILGLNIFWTSAQFKQLIKSIPGNANRLKHILTIDFELSSIQVEEIVARFIPLKKELYINKYLPKIDLREGVEEFIKEIIASHIKLAIVSTSYESQIHALLDIKLSNYKHKFKPILGKESGQKTGVNGILYEKCLAQLNLEAKDCLVIEDSEAGLKAATKAKISTAIFYNDYTENENFKNAVLIEKSFKNVDISLLLQGKYSSKN